eukprot:365255-Chlamydomonas_euryale.AAC.31
MDPCCVEGKASPLRSHDAHSCVCDERGAAIEAVLECHNESVLPLCLGVSCIADLLADALGTESLNTPGPAGSLPPAPLPPLKRTGTPAVVLVSGV